MPANQTRTKASHIRGRQDLESRWSLSPSQEMDEENGGEDGGEEYEHKDGRGVLGTPGRLQRPVEVGTFRYAYFGSPYAYCWT